jgi:hypothetical protein
VLIFACHASKRLAAKIIASLFSEEHNSLMNDHVETSETSRETLTVARVFVWQTVENKE